MQRLANDYTPVLVNKICVDIDFLEPTASFDKDSFMGFVQHAGRSLWREKKAI